MSRVAKNPIFLPQNVEVKVENNFLQVKGVKGNLQYKLPKEVDIKLDNNTLTFTPKDKSITANALAGTSRAVVNNMVRGVGQGFERKLSLVGVGYRAQAQSKMLNLSLGFSHPVSFPIPEGIQIETPSQTEIVIKGINKGLVGQVAANIRAYRPPEPYKGKGVRYSNEVVIQKEAKKK